MFLELKRLYEDSEGPFPSLSLHTFEVAEFRTHKPDWFLEINPNGKVPALVDREAVREAQSETPSSLTLWDGCAISLYLLDALDRDGRLAPRDPQYRAKLYQLCFYCSGTVDNLSASSSPIQRVMSDPLCGEQPAIVAQNQKAWKELCGPLLSEWLGEKTFMYGDEFSAVDVVVGCNLMWLHTKKDWVRNEFPSLYEYYKRLCDRKAFQEATHGRIDKTTGDLQAAGG